MTVVIVTDEFESWYGDLSADEQEDVRVSVDKPFS